MDFTAQQQARYDRIRATFNGPLTVGFLQQTRADVFSVSLHALPEKFRTALIATDAGELRTILSSGLSAGWKFDAASETFTFTTPKVQEPVAPVVAAPSANVSAPSDPLERANLRWLSSVDVQRKYPSRADYFNAVKLGLETV